MSDQSSSELVSQQVAPSSTDEMTSSTQEETLLEEISLNDDFINGECLQCVFSALVYDVFIYLYFFVSQELTATAMECCIEVVMKKFLWYRFRTQRYHPVSQSAQERTTSSQTSNCFSFEVASLLLVAFLWWLAGWQATFTLTETPPSVVVPMITSPIPLK